ncbi:MAG: inositol monophosphatase [Verrucomicrobia bacterium]|nr:inositol monophosphatase [Verrucomicrobiota bacterium]MDE3098939.1 inositol monophosphatase [Verrucomicrobiota bacterium]
MKRSSFHRELTVAIKAARAAGTIIRDNWHKAKRVKLFDAHDIKLELDVRCQKTIEKVLFAAFPETSMIGEEGCSGDPDSSRRWVVDPIDGTVNYFFGMPHAAVSIALQERAARHPSRFDTVLGVIYDPFTDELWTATRNGRTTLNGRAVYASRRSRVNDSLVAMGFSKSAENLRKSLPHLNRLARRAKKIRIMGSAALELAYVASGRLDVYIERTINLWDIAAGALMVECSGGEMILKPLPDGRFRMCADNGLLRRKLHVESLLK